MSVLPGLADRVGARSIPPFGSDQNPMNSPRIQQEQQLGTGRPAIIG